MWQGELTCHKPCYVHERRMWLAARPKARKASIILAAQGFVADACHFLVSKGASIHYERQLRSR